MRIELNFEQTGQYFSEDPVILQDIENAEDEIISEVEIDIENRTVMYRYSTKDLIGTATWFADDYEGAYYKLFFNMGIDIKLLEDCL